MYLEDREKNNLAEIHLLFVTEGECHCVELQRAREECQCLLLELGREKEMEGLRQGEGCPLKALDFSQKQRGQTWGWLHPSHFPKDLGALPWSSEGHHGWVWCKPVKSWTQSAGRHEGKDLLKLQDLSHL